MSIREFKKVYARKGSDSSSGSDEEEDQSEEDPLKKEESKKNVDGGVKDDIPLEKIEKQVQNAILEEETDEDEDEYDSKVLNLLFR